MLKKIAILFATTLCFLHLSAQQVEDDRSKFFFGGNFGLQFGNVTFIEASPTFGYRLTPKLAVGAGIIFQYAKFSADVYGIPLTTTVAGSKFFGRYVVYENLFLTAEPQFLSVQTYDFNFNKVRRIVPVLFVGGGYRQPLGERSFVTISLLYDLIDEPDSPYNQPYIGLGFNFSP